MKRPAGYSLFLADGIAHTHSHTHTHTHTHTPFRAHARTNRIPANTPVANINFQLSRADLPADQQIRFFSFLWL